ncbi:MAG: VRR-NUC domain-containing protein [Clostridiales bacterium]|jgi:hypothetical protein|nr:VRR-NUC domain-containing protein [Clostridiales bacterium]
MAGEKLLERKLKHEIEKLGGECLKFYSHYRVGMPDRFLIMPNGLFYMAEIKGCKGKTSGIQNSTIEKLRSLGHKVFVINSDGSLKDLINEIRAGIDGGI